MSAATTALTGTARTAGTTPGLGGILTVVILGSIMSALDVTIVNVALHPLAVAFDAPVATVQWIATGYTLALATVGAAALVLAARLLRRDEPQEPRRLDVPGLLMLSPGLALLIYGLSTGGERGDFTVPAALLPAVAGLLLAAGFIGRGLTARYPLLQPSLFRDRTFAAGLATMVLFPCGYFGSMLLTPMYYQTVRGLSSTDSGLLGAPLAFAVGISMQIATRRIDKVSPRLLVVSGIVVAALGLSLFTAQLGCTPPSGNWSATSLTACRRSRISPSAASTSPAGCSNLMYLAVFVSPGPQ